MLDFMEFDKALSTSIASLAYPCDESTKSSKAVVNN